MLYSSDFVKVLAEFTSGYFARKYDVILALSQIFTGAEIFTMQDTSPAYSPADDLDPTTARLAAELAANILPPLTESLMSAIPAADFSGALERSNRLAQDLRTSLEKVVRSGIDEDRAGRSVLMQSISSVLEDISALKRTAEKIPASVESALKAKPENQTIDIHGLEKKLDGITEMLDELIHGLKSFGEAYAADREQHTPLVAQHIYSGNDAQLEQLVNSSLPDLEGLLRANAKAQSKELEEFSREVSAQLEQNNAALIHEVSEKVGEEVARYGAEVLSKLNDERKGQFERMAGTLKIVMWLAGGSFVMAAVILVIMLVK